MNGDLTETVSRVATTAGDPNADDGAPRLIVLCECNRLTAPALRMALRDLHEVTLGRDSRRTLTRNGRVAVLGVPDHEVSRKHLRLARQPEGWEVSDLGSKNGILVNGEPTPSTTLTDGDVIEAGGTVLMFREDGGTLDRFSDRFPDRDLTAESATPIPFRTVSLELEHRLDQLTKIARGTVPVLIRGETGTGKELIARAIHDVSARRGAFVPINCGALPRNLIESELFGHRRGAFSGANEERDGLVRRAHGGTLFLDEIAELPEESQVALLRVLQEGEVRPVGASDPVKVDIRVVAATHQDIPARIVDGRFRQDLYARLAGFEMSLAHVARAPRGPRQPDRLDPAARHQPAPQRITLQRVRRPLPCCATRGPSTSASSSKCLRAAVALTDTGELRFDHLSEAIRTYRAAQHLQPAPRRPRPPRARHRAPPRARRQRHRRRPRHGQGPDPDPPLVPSAADRALAVPGVSHRAPVRW